MSCKSKKRKTCESPCKRKQCMRFRALRRQAMEQNVLQAREYLRLKPHLRVIVQDLSRAMKVYLERGMDPSNIRRVLNAISEYQEAEGFMSSSRVVNAVQVFHQFCLQAMLEHVELLGCALSESCQAVYMGQGTSKRKRSITSLITDLSLTSHN